mgnify:CR=1 FL=1
MKIRHPEKVNKPINPLKKKPSWIKSKLTNSHEFFLTKSIVNQYKLKTVCQEANCPNITECWSKRHATFLIMGDTCTRACAFCDVITGKPKSLDPLEPLKISSAVKKNNKEFRKSAVQNEDSLHYSAGIPSKNISDYELISSFKSFEKLNQWLQDNTIDSISVENFNNAQNRDLYGDYIIDIYEKPELKMEILSGIYLIKPHIIDLIPKDSYYGIDNLIKNMVSKKMKVVKYKITDYWLDIGRIEDYNAAQEAYNEHFFND